MSGRQDGIPIADAAARLGLSAEAVRKRLQRGTLAGYKDADGGWFVVLSDKQKPSGRQDTVRTKRQDGDIPRPDVLTENDEPIEGAYRVAGEIAAEVALVPLATMVEELRGLAGQLNDMARRNEALALEVGQLRERQVGQETQLLAKYQTIATQQETIAELRRRAAVAEAELARRHEDVEAAQATSAGPEGVERFTEGLEDTWGGWRRLWRSWGAKG